MRAGQLVVATPVLEDPEFARTVVLLLQADEQDGALGLVLNRPSGTGVDEVLPGWAPLAASPQVVFSGGPVQPEAAVCLGHRRLGSPQVAAYAEVEGVPGGSVGTVDLDAAPGDLSPVVDRVRLFAGYAGLVGRAARGRGRRGRVVGHRRAAGRRLRRRARAAVGAGPAPAGAADRLRRQLPAGPDPQLTGQGVAGR